MRGRPPKPTARKRLEGTARPDRINADEPEPEKGIPEPIGMLAGVFEEHALEMWGRIVPILDDMGVLTLADGAALTQYCNAYARLRVADSHIEKYGMTQENPKSGMDQKRPEVMISKEASEMMDKLGAKFGLTPSDRTRIKTEKPKGSASADFLFGKKPAKKPQLKAVK